MTTVWADTINYLLQELGDFLLQENGDKLIIEPTTDSLKHTSDWTFEDKT